MASPATVESSGPPDFAGRFFGVWVLDAALGPEADHSTELRLPAVVQTILPDDDGALWFHARWRDASGSHESAFRAGFEGGEARPDRHTARWHEGQLITAYGGGTVERRLEGDDRLVVVVRDGGEAVEMTFRRAAVKQVMIYRRDLAMRKGKIAAQCAHASMAVFFRRDRGPIDGLSVALDGPMAAWAKGRFAKVVLSVEGEPELLEIVRLAEAHGLPFALITDSGKTEFRGQPTRTTVALGPATDVEIDTVTGPGGKVATKLA